MTFKLISLLKSEYKDKSNSIIQSIIQLLKKECICDKKFKFITTKWMQKKSESQTSFLKFNNKFVTKFDDFESKY